MAVVLLLGATSCGSRNNNRVTDQERIDSTLYSTQEEEREITARKIELDAGYAWSALDNDYVPLYERAIPFMSVQHPDMDHLAYVIFNRDSTRAEIFFNSEGAESMVLERRQTPSGPVWNIEDDDTYNVRRVNGDWTVERRGQVVYRHDARLNSVSARFEGSDGVSRMLHPVRVTFFPAGETAIVTVGDKTYHLTQYPTGSGYGYKNDEVDLRGKGEEATLTYTDENIRDLQLREMKD